MKLYFTYGSSEKMPFKGGWSIVEAETYEQCLALYKVAHPQKDDCINCAFIYTEDEFKQTGMYEYGNLGVRTHEIIRLDITRKQHEEVQCE